MRIGLALPQYDYSVAGESTLRWDTIVDYASTAERAGYHSLWLSDHLFLDVSKYGGPPDRRGAYDPIVALGALARMTTTVRLGTLVLCEALRPASVPLPMRFGSMTSVTPGATTNGAPSVACRSNLIAAGGKPRSRSRA